MKIISLFKNKSILKSWLLSYFSILLIPILISSIVYIKSSDIIKQEITETNAILLKQVQQVVDNKLMDIERLSFQISWNSKLKGLMYIKDQMQPQHRYTITQLLKEFSLQKMSNGFVDDFFIYFKNSNMILCSDNNYEANLLKEDLLFSTKISLDQWNTLTQEYHTKDYQPINIQMPEVLSKSNTIALIQTLTLDYSKEAAATLVILLNKSYLVEAIQSIQWLEHGTVLIIDPEDQILVSTQPENEMMSLQYNSLINKGIQRDTIDGKDVYVSCIPSQVNGWKFVYITPSAVFKEKVSYIQMLIIISIFACLLLGGIVSFLFSKRNYNPVSSIIRNIASRNGTSICKGFNEYQYIQESLEDNYNEKNRIYNQLRKQNDVVQSHFLMKLMQGNIESNHSMNEILSTLNIHFAFDHFAVLLFHIENYNPLFISRECSENPENLRLLYLIINNTVEEFADKNHHVYMTEIGGILSCLVNINEGSLDSADQDLFAFANEMKQLIQKKYFIHCTLSISQIHHPAQEIHTAFKEALEAMEYRIAVGRERIIRYIDVKDAENKYNYSMEDEQKLINFVKTGDFKNAETALNSIFDKNFPNEKLSIKMIKCFMFDLVSTILNAMNAINPVMNDFWSEEMDPVNHILYSETIHEMRSHTLDILKHVCNHILDKRKDRTSEITERVIVYVQKNYMDINLNISMIADELQLTPPYISKLFKEETGESLLDYINKVRLMKAKSLLASHQRSINEIARDTGYYNSNAFIRLFKKYEGITPGQFKKISDAGGIN